MIILFIFQLLPPLIKLHDQLSLNQRTGCEVNKLAIRKKEKVGVRREGERKKKEEKEREKEGGVGENFCHSNPDCI